MKPKYLRMFKEGSVVRDDDAPKGLLRRTRLIEKMDSVAHCGRHVFIDAPFGYGKSVLVDQFAACSGYSTIRLSVGRDSASLGRIAADLLGFAGGNSDAVPPTLAF